MIHVNVRRNPLDQTKREQRTTDAGATLRSLTIEINGGASEWPFPTIATVDGKPWMRGRWNEPLSDGMIVEFRSTVRGGGGGNALSIGAMIATTMMSTVLIPIGQAVSGIGGITGQNGLMQFGMQLQKFGSAGRIGGLPETPSVPSSLSGESGSPTYSIDYKANRKRVGEPIPVVYGTHRLLPDLITESYSYFDTNDDQYAAMVLCLGIGEFDVDTSSLKFGEAPFSELDDISYQIVAPGASQTLISDHVSNSQAINGQALVGPVAETVILAHGPLLTMTVIDPATSGNGWIATLRLTVSAPGSLSSIGVSDSFDVTGDTNIDGTYTCTATGGGSIDFEFDTFGGSTPTPATYKEGIVIKGGAPLWSGSGYLSITDTSMIGAVGLFSAVNPGDTLHVRNTDFDGYYSILTVSGDKSTVTFPLTQTSYYDFANNPDVGIDNSGWIGWFEVATAGKETEQIECDFVAPRGLGTINGSGGVDIRTVTAEIQYQGLNSSGTPAAVIKYRTFTMTAAQAKSFRRSTKWTNDTGYDRVRIRARRTTTESTDTSALDNATWTGLKAYMDDVVTYPGVTTIAILAKATEQLTAQQSGQVSVVATRKIPIWNGTTWSANTATNSIAWAIADVLRNTETGVRLSDSQIDLAGLLALDTVWDGRGDEFNGVFDQTVTAWEAVQKIARCGRSIPVMANGSVTFIRDGEKTVRSAIFNPSNINPGSLRIEYAFKKEHDPDGVDLTWINQDAWQRDIVSVAMPGVSGDATRPEAVDLFGCTNLDQATREATYLARRMAYVRKTISWQTEMDGRLLMVGDMVALAHDVPSWSQSGEVIGFADNGSTCDYLTSQPINWTAPGTKYVLLKKQDGTVSGPHTATEITGGFNISDPSWVPNSTLENGERTTFVFCAGSSIDVVITDITPSGDTTVNITGVPYDARIHASGA